MYVCVCARACVCMCVCLCVSVCARTRANDCLLVRAFFVHVFISKFQKDKKTSETVDLSTPIP